MNDNKPTPEFIPEFILEVTPEFIPEFIPMDTKVTSIVMTTPRVVTAAGKIVGREIQLALTLEGRADPLIITTRGYMVLNRLTCNSTRYLRLNGEEWVSGGETLEERSNRLGEEMAKVPFASTQPPTHINMSKWGRSKNPPKPRPEFTHTPLSVTLEELGMRKVSP